MVATPIGNLEDMTYRAVKVLSSVDVIACEDTRHTMHLLSHYGIKKRLIACHAHNEDESAKGILALLDSGSDVAYCSDAGTPGVSDPGARLVEYIRSESSHTIVPVPGASAFVSLVSAAGNIGKSFTFEGFLSPKKGRRQKRLAELFSRDEAFIIYESPFRVLKTLEDIKETGTGSVDDVIASLSARDAIKGEFAMIIIPEVADDKCEEDQDA